MSLFKSLAINLGIIAILGTGCSDKDLSQTGLQSNDSGLPSEAYLRHKLSDHSLVIETDLATYVVSQRYSHSLTLERNPESNSLPAYALNSPAMIVPATLTEKDNQLVFGTANAAVKVVLNPFSIQLVQGDEVVTELTQATSEYNSGVSASFSLGDEAVYGAGARVVGMDRRGHSFPLYNRAHYGFETHSTQMYYSLPVVMTSDHWAITWDNPANGRLDIDVDNSGQIVFDSEYGQQRVHFTTAESHAELTHNFTEMTGRQPLPPRWALGMYASRFGYHSQAEVENVHRLFREQGYPLDAVVLDLYWFGTEMKGTMGNLDWEPNAWPSPKAMISNLADDGVNTIVITEPFILTTSKQWDSAVEAGALATDQVGEPKTFDFYFGNTGLVDVFSESGRNWFNAQYERIADYGVAGWWGDLGEPEVHPEDALHNIAGIERTFSANEVHNAYGHQWADSLHQKLNEMQPEQRSFIMMRSGYVGSQRYGLVPWSGDVNRTWGGLKSQVEISLQMGMQGLNYMHSDIGGFAGGEVFDPELYIRWFQYGVFQPVLRPHAQENIPSEPVFHDYATREITLEYAKLRYKLMPYIYTLAYENSATGRPMMRPMFTLTDTIDSRGLSTEQYLFGDAFLVRPIVEDGTRATTVSLPSGVWFNYWTEEIFDGGQSIDVDAPMSQIPLFVKAGSFIPMDRSSITSLAHYRGDKIALHYYHDDRVAQAQSQWYEDDGTNPNAIEQNAFELFTLSANYAQKQLKIDIAPSGDSYQSSPETREIELVIHGISKPVKHVMCSGDALEFSHNQDTQILRTSYSLARNESVACDINFE